MKPEASFRPKGLPGLILLELRARRTAAELELWSLRKKGGYFREVFGRELFVMLE
jgi:hypothetical protein